MFTIADITVEHRGFQLPTYFLNAFLNVEKAFKKVGHFYFALCYTQTLTGRLCCFTLRTPIGGFVELSRIFSLSSPLDSLELSHLMVVSDIVDKVNLGTDIMNGDGFVLDLRKNFL